MEVVRFVTRWCKTQKQAWTHTQHNARLNINITDHLENSPFLYIFVHLMMVVCISKKRANVGLEPLVFVLFSVHTDTHTVNTHGFYNKT